MNYLKNNMDQRHSHSWQFQQHISVFNMNNKLIIEYMILTLSMRLNVVTRSIESLFMIGYSLSVPRNNYSHILKRSFQNF